MRRVCNEIGGISHKWFKIGVQLDIPHHTLKKFEKEDEPLPAAIDYWLKGNVDSSDVPVSWQSIVDALDSPYVQEPGLAEKIRKKYCTQEDVIEGEVLFKLPNQFSKPLKLL